MNALGSLGVTDSKGKFHSDSLPLTISFLRNQSVKGGKTQKRGKEPTCGMGFKDANGHTQ